MYQACIYCHKSLGTNSSIESFQVGKRIAYDEARGRLWAVCRNCERWNLAPFDTRFEAIEECERAFRGTTLRVSTDNIGLARLREGTELIRIGNPQRPEFAAWRYGDQFGRRRLKAAVLGVGAVGAAGLGVAGLVGVGAGLAGVAIGIHMMTILTAIASNGVEGKPIVNPAGGFLRPIGSPRLVQLEHAAEGWGIDIGYTQLMNEPDPPVQLFRKSAQGIEIGRMVFAGNEAIPVLRRYMPRINRAGASRRIVEAGLSLIDEAGDVENFGRWAAQQRRKWGAMQSMGDTGSLSHIPVAARLAFEMAIFESEEKRAMLGELSQLERAWEAAEQIARIADSLGVPRAIEERVERMKAQDKP